MFAIKLSMEKQIKNFLSAWFSDLPAINATSFTIIQLAKQATEAKSLLFLYKL